MDEAATDQAVRVAIGAHLQAHGVLPTLAEVRAATGLAPAEVEASFARLRDGHVYIPQPDGREIYAYNPFCVGPTTFRVRAAGRDWWAICGWDALGIPAALGSAGTVRAACGDGCGEELVVEVAADGTARGEAVFGSGVPIREAWADIRFT